MINYHNKTFLSAGNTSNEESTFLFEQEGQIVSGTYNGGSVLFGHLLAITDDTGKLNIRYHHINTKGELITGTCFSVPEVLPDGKLRLHQKWKNTSGTKSEGESIIEEA